MADTPSDLQRDAAHHIVTEYLGVRAGENAIVESWDHTMPMAAAMVDEIRRAGGRVLLVHEDENAWWRAIDRKQSTLLGRSSEPEWAALKAADVYVMFWGPGDPDRIDTLREKTFDEALDWNSTWYEVARKTALRGVRMTAGFVNEGRARKWGLDRARWEEGVLRACLVDPEELVQSSARLCRTLSRGRHVRITHSNGTDLEVALAGIAPRVMDGRPHPRDKRYGPYGMMGSIPGGYVDAVLDSKTAEGRFRANRRTNIWWNSHAGATLDFRGGKLASYSVEDGEEQLARQYRRATRGRDRTSVLTFGLNPAVKDVAYLEKGERGCVTLQIGGNRGLGGTNGSNFFTWFTLGGSDIAVDGAPVMRAGELL